MANERHITPEGQFMRPILLIDEDQTSFYHNLLLITYLPCKYVVGIEHLNSIVGIIIY